MRTHEGSGRSLSSRARCHEVVSSINRHQIGLIDTTGLMVSRYHSLYIGSDTLIPIPTPDGKIPAWIAILNAPLGAEPGSGSRRVKSGSLTLLTLSGSQAHYLYIGSEPVSLNPKENRTPTGSEKPPAAGPPRRHQVHRFKTPFLNPLGQSQLPSMEPRIASPTRCARP